jgi:hypothetical protein
MLACCGVFGLVLHIYGLLQAYRYQSRLDGVNGFGLLVDFFKNRLGREYKARLSTAKVDILLATHGLDGCIHGHHQPSLSFFCPALGWLRLSLLQTALSPASLCDSPETPLEARRKL